ncbi:CDP-alcohol phosphatidyltransferase family protein [Glycomyces salinus]|uniref:CDP-alcohol phosphatidyltransferase family protein n=1 Tax=Glycomyces salinus TaxID=980294 RepID=UPI0018EDCD15|nr:CDP-alcohol phosphatidyltransferase family protein [Glycomyces salinus]
MTRETETRQRRPAWWTVPNLVTAIRFALIAPIVALLVWDSDPLGAAALTALWGASDWVDGFLARKLDQASRVGEALDPLADRVGIVCIAVASALAGAGPLWLIAAFPVVDLVVGGLYWWRGRACRLRVSRIGKVRTAVSMAALFAVMLGLDPDLDWMLPIGQLGLAVGALLHIAAGAGYLRQILR